MSCLDSAERQLIYLMACALDRDRSRVLPLHEGIDIHGYDGTVLSIG